MSAPRFRLRPLSTALLCLAPLAVGATNGMNMEGYGPISTALGGASQAIDHGTAAMAQNPATLALMPRAARLDLAVGLLGPDVASAVPGAPGSPRADSSGTRYAMPGFGYVRRSGEVTWGLGLFAQGGMGTEYDATSFLALGSGQPVRSELSVGRVLLPLVWQASPEFAVGATLDYVWAGLDLRMALTGAQLGGLVTGASGNLGAALPALAPAPWARIDFSNDNDYTGRASASGWAGKLGFVWKATPDLTVGGSYQFQTKLSDMDTGVAAASLSAAGGFVDSGRVTVIDFQWPATAALGVAWQAGPALLLAADVKRIGWADVMKDFRLRYDSAGVGGSVSFALPQQWKDQTAWSLGLAYALTPDLVLRGGANLGGDPVPDAFVNPLFPATVKTHYTAGLGWRFAPAWEFNGSLSVVPEQKITNAQGVVVTHSQTNAQLMVSYRF